MNVKVDKESNTCMDTLSMKNRKQIQQRVEEIELRIERIKNNTASSEVSDLDSLSMRELAIVRDFLNWTLK
jgi:hypothetical protein